MITSSSTRWAEHVTRKISLCTAESNYAAWKYGKTCARRSLHALVAGNTSPARNSIYRRQSSFLKNAFWEELPETCILFRYWMTWIDWVWELETLVYIAVFWSENFKGRERLLRTTRCGQDWISCVKNMVQCLVLYNTVMNLRLA
jgi:hypothetical protein